MLKDGPRRSYLFGSLYQRFVQSIKLDDIPADSEQSFLLGHTRDAKGKVVNFHRLDCAHCCTTGSVGGGMWRCTYIDRKTSLCVDFLHSSKCA